MSAPASREEERRSRFSRNGLLAVSVTVTILLTIGFAIRAPSKGDVDMIDHALFTRTVENMQRGSGYYEAMEQAFAEIYGPDRADVTESVRAFRPPFPFFVWNAIGSERGIWFLFLIVAAGTGILASLLASNPLSGVLVTGYVLTLGMFRTDGSWTAQFTASELWALPAVFATVLAVRRERWWPAAVLALGAATVRETAATMLLAGAGLSLLGRLPRLPWLTAAVGGVGLYLVHAMLAAPFIDPGVAEALPAPAQFPDSLLTMIGFGLPTAVVLGAALWIAALAHTLRRLPHGLLLSAVLWLPLVGLVLDRPHWGVMVVPFTLVWGLDELIQLGRSVVRRFRLRSGGAAT